MVLDIKNLSYDIDEISILKDISLSIQKGEKVGLMGANGSGKSTLLRCIAGLLNFSASSFEILGINNKDDFKKIREQIGYLFQHSEEQFIFPIVKDDIAFELLSLGIKKEQIRVMVDEILDAFDIKSIQDRVVYNLSGGQKRLCAIAGVLVVPNKKLLLLDEPSNELDSKAQEILINMLKKHQASMLISSHDERLLSNVCSRIIRL